MNLRGIVGVPLVLVISVLAQSDLTPEVLLLSRIRHHTASDLSNLPNFTCLETIERATRNSPLKPFDVRDVVQVEVAHVGDHELFAWPGASNFESRPLADMIGTGMSSNGEYSGHARSIFVGGYGVTHYSGQEDLGGHRAARFDYEILPTFAGFTMNISGRRGTVGTRGSFWAGSTTFDLLRLTVEATDIPAELGVRAMLTSIDYGRIRIGSGDFLLPQSARTWLGLETGVESRNQIDFTHCRQYATESVLSFEVKETHGLLEPAPLPTEFTLPPNLIVSLRLESPIRASTAKVGDAISAVLNSDLKQNGQIVAPKGAIVSGRLRMLQKEVKSHLAGLEFTDLTFENKHSRFLAKLVSTDSRFAQQQLTNVQRQVSDAGGASTVTRTSLPPELPGVGTFFIPAGVAELPRGMAMEWKTVGLGK